MQLPASRDAADGAQVVLVGVENALKMLTVTMLQHQQHDAHACGLSVEI